MHAFHASSHKDVCYPNVDVEYLMCTFYASSHKAFSHRKENVGSLKCMCFSCLQPLGFLLPKGRCGIFNVWNALSAYYAHEGEICTDESVQNVDKEELKNGLFSVVSRS